MTHPQPLGGHPPALTLVAASPAEPPLTEPKPDCRRLGDLLDRQALHPRFQAIVCLQTGLPVAYECLTRPEAASFAHADELFDTADRCGQLWNLEALARAAALRELAHLPASAQVFLNCSPAVFSDPRFPEAIAENIRQTPALEPSRLVLEITERADDAAPGDLARNVEAVRSLGFRVALDDLGARMNGLERLVTLRPDWLKLDRTLASAIDTDPVRQGLVRHFARFAAEIGVGLVAEGVETDAELRTLIELGAPHAQGYRLGRPVTAIEAAREHAHARLTPVPLAA